MAIVYVNDAACRLHNLTREQLIAAGSSGALAMPSAQIEKTLDAIIARGTPAEPVEIMRLGKGGQMGWYELRRHPVFASGRWLIVSFARDITQAKNAQARIVHLNRVYAMQSGITALILRVRTREELFDTACRIAGKEGGFPMTMIAWLDRATSKLVPVASYGFPSDVLAGLTKRFASNEIYSSGPKAGQTMAERAILGKKTVLNNDLAGDPNAIHAKRHLSAGIRSMAMLPLMVGNVAVGVLALYSTQVNFFVGEELKLLLNLTQDIAFAVDHIDKQERLAYLAHFDVLTGLANRTLFLDRVSQYLHSAANAGHRLVVYLADVERFKNINDSLGQDAGDALLQQIGQWLTHTVGDSNLVARIGTNHFAIVRPELRDSDELDALVEGQLKNFSSHPFHLNEEVFRISIKAGAAVFPVDGTDAATLYKNAEAALKKAKMRGEPYLFYNESMTRRTSGNLSLESELRQALDRQELVLHCQPKINLAHALKLKVVAEGVETEEQERLLRLLGCDEMQGFLISKALPCKELEARYLSQLT